MWNVQLYKVVSVLPFLSQNREKYIMRRGQTVMAPELRRIRVNEYHVVTGPFSADTVVLVALYSNL